MSESSANDSHGSAAQSLRVAVVTISSDRGLEDDPAGTALVEGLEGAGIEITVREHVNSDYDQVQSIVSRLIDRTDVELVITAGGTSVEPDDDALEAVEPLLEKELTAFAELVTALAYDRIGTRVVTVRTLAGVAEGTPVFCLPGTADTATLALEEIILSEAETVVELAREDDPDTEGERGETGGDRASAGTDDEAADREA
ncbi:MogA/MoaB family molybdenum cofactor biosynthesis protein [Natrinema caseinilyticum]|uniref:MogA/MoaB family molybdenum cofactor biosynthesis protein n=1 Tax=Natrinema caseinilyticum TaxID=2961570 RepID=UPI0020C4E997|nr:molybdopterin-binding protein [Natrinema caseinilyticum]